MVITKSAPVSIGVGRVLPGHALYRIVEQGAAFF
jgi:hypothetical protein